MGYSNVAGDLNVYSDTSTSTLTVRNGAIFNGGLAATAGVSTFGNVVAANLTVTGNFTVTATNTQVSNSLSINNFGTATALKVVQYEGGGPGHIHNVAEFWDYQTLAMVIDPEANVGIHTGASPGYALTVVDGVLIDTLTLTNPLAVSAGGIGVTTTTQNYVFAGPQFGSGAPDFRYLVNSDLPSIISVSNVSGNGSGLSSLVGSNVTGNVANATVSLVVSQAAQPNITSVGLLSNLDVSNSVTTTNIFANTLTLANATSTINVLGSVTATTFYGALAGANTGAFSNLYSANALTTTNIFANTLTLANATSTINVLGSVTATTFYGAHAGANTGAFSNLYSANALTTTNIFANTLTLANATSTINVLGSVTATTFYGAHAGANTGAFSNLYSANALTTTNIFANTLTLANATSTINVLGSVTATTFYGAHAGANTGAFSNLYSANALTTTNLFANTMTLANASASITGNLYVSNALSTINVFVSNGLDVGPGTLGTNVVIFSNISGGANTFVMDSNGRVSIGAGAFGGGSLLSFGQQTSNKIITLYDGNSADNPGTATNFYGFGINSGVLRYQVGTAGDDHIFYGAANEYARITNVGISVKTGADPTANLQVTGNAYISNALTTTNVFAITATVPGFTSQFTVNGGGTVTHSAAGYLFWSARVLVIPAWKNAAYATGGHWNINCPTSGTIVFNGGTVTCTASGIPMVGYVALYYRVVPGTAESSVQANFLLKDFTDTTYSPDSNWILLAVRNGDGAEIKWMPGNTTIPLGGTFYTPSASYDKVQVAGTVVVDSARTGIFNNLYSANALTTTNVFANTLTLANATSTINVIGSVTATTFYGAVAGANTGAFSNLYSANSVTTTNLFTAGFTSNGSNTIFNYSTLTVPFVNCTNLNVYSASNVLTMSIPGSTGQTSLGVTGNIYASNALTTTNAYLTGALNVQGVSNLANVYALRYFGDGGLLSNITNFVQPVANLVVSNAVTTTNLFANTLTLANATSTINVLGSVTATTFYGALAGANTGAFSNLYSANALTTTNVFVSNGLDVGPGALGTNVVVFSNISGGSNVFVMDSNGRIGIGTTTPGIYMQSIYSNTIGDHLLLATDSTIGPLIRFQNRNSGGTIRYSFVKGDQGSLQFFTATSSQRQTVYLSDSIQNYYTDGLERMRMTSVGMSIATVANPRATLDVAGNIYASNALSTTNLFANTLTLANATSTINVLGSVTATTFYGALAGANTGAFSNLYSANALSTTNLFANTLTLANATSTINVLGSVTATTFYGALAGANTGAFSNLYSANALTTTNLFANTLTLANATSTINVLGSVTATTFYGAHAGANTGAFSNLYSANALTTTNLFANTLTLANATASITGNLYVSNAVTTTNLYTAGISSNASDTIFNSDTLVVPFISSTTLNVFSTANILTQTIQGSTGATSLNVTGNLYVSNALSTTNAYLSGALNVQGFSNLTNIYALRYFGDGGLLSNITNFVQPVANLVVSNAITTTNLFANTLTLANATASITGNLSVSNAMSTTNAYLTGALNVQGVSNLWNANVANVYALRYFGDGGLLSNVSGLVQPVANLVVSNAVTTTNIFANTMTLANATASITGNLYVSNAVTTTNLYTAGISSNASNTIFNFDTLTVPFFASTTLNAATANILTLTTTTANLATGNITTANVSSLAVIGNTSFVGNVTVTSDASSNNYVLARRVPTGSLDVTQYVTGSVPLTTTTNLIKNYLSNAATIGSNVISSTSYNVVTLPGTASSGVNFPNQGTSPGRANLSLAPFYVEAWVNIRAVGSSQVIIERSLGTTYDWSLFLSVGNLLTFTVWNNTASYSASNATAFTTTTGWVHVAGSYVPATTITGAVRCFVNGGLGGTTDSVVTTAPRVTSTANVYIGTNTSNQNLTGNVADVRIFYGGTVPTATFAAPTLASPAIPFSITQPSYITGSTNCYLALQTSYFPGASTAPYGPVLTLPGTVGSCYSQLAVPSSSTISTTGFTVEAWVNYASFANADAGFAPWGLGNFPTTSSGGFWWWGVTTTGAVRFGAGPYVTTAGTITSGSWNHIMAQCNGSNIYMTINGTFQNLTATSYVPAGGNGTIAPTTMGIAQILGTPISIGQYDSTRGPNFAIAKARIVLGTTGANGNVYSSGNFTPSPNFNPTLPSGATVMWQLDSQYPLPTYPSFFDVPVLPQQTPAYGAEPIVVGGVTSNVLGPYTTSPQLDSIRFDGTGYIDYGNAASSALCSNLWASPWTIEGWVYINNTTNFHNIVARNTAAGSPYDWSFYVAATTMYPSFIMNSASPVTNTGTTAVAPNTWTHLAVTWDGSKSNIYVGGAMSNSMSLSSFIYTPSQNFQIGQNNGFYTQGNLAELRVSNVARYTGSSYTVPNVADGSAPFVTDRNTLLLMKSLAGQVGTTLEVQGRGTQSVSLGATQTVRAYPPAPMSSYLLDTTSNASVTYGQGKYVASASSERTNNTAWMAFNTLVSQNGGEYQTPTSAYTSSVSGPGAYTGTVSTTDTLGNSYAGEWLQLQLPVSVLLSSYTINEVGLTYNPGTWWVLGSRDGMIWTLVDSRAGIGATWNSVGGYRSLTFTVGATQAYTYYRMVLNTLFSNGTGNTALGIAEWTLNGTEESLCITSDSKVGVGIANPQRALEVAGDLVVGGTISGGAGLGSFRNRIINGDMRIAQRGTSSTVVGYGCVDRWSIASSLVATVTQSQQTLAASDTPYQLGFRNSWRITANTGISVSTWFSTTPYAYPTHNIEAYNISDFNWGTAFGSPVTLSFWIRSNIPSGSQTGFVFRNVAAGGSHWTINQPFTYNNTGTWQYVASTVQPPPNGSGWNTGTNTGIELFICPVYTQKSSNVAIWQNVNNVGLPGSYIWPQTAGNYIEFTGVQLEKGTVATPFEFRPYATELALCQRYYQEMPNTNGGHFTGGGRLLACTNSTSGTNTLSGLYLTTPMRAAPAPTYYGSGLTSGNYNINTSSSGASVSTSVAAASTTTSQTAGNMIAPNLPPITAPGGSVQWIDMGWGSTNFGITLSAEL
jgi:hypothetical protein